MAKILIIGGGVAGLSAGIYAQMNGHQATICERQKNTGGNLTGWQRGEYHIDNCIHWLTGTNPAMDTYKIWKDLGDLGNVDVYQGDTLYTYEYKGKRLSLYRDLEKMQDEMIAIAPEDKKEILSLIKAVNFLQGMSGIGGKKHNKKYNIFQDLAA
jgi:phytoene dehydrogenase-like protein